MIDHLSNFLKGALMGAANVIPGVSGGTMALLTGIFGRLVDAIKAFDAAAVRLVLRGRFRAFSAHVDLPFLAAVGIGVLASILTLARLLEYLFEHQAVNVWSFFFGLILASVYFVGRTIRRWSVPVLLLFALGTVVAGGIIFLEPASENASVPYLLLCGAVAMCSMILPGISGSYVLLLMGNYQLVMIEAVTGFRLEILIPVGIGAVAGLAAFARVLSWIFARFRDQTTALLTGFIFGSLVVIWPWKRAIEETFGEKVKVVGYHYAWPEPSLETAVAVAVMLAGVVAIAAVETAAGKTRND